MAGRRTVVNVGEPRGADRAPIPAGARVGNVICSSAIGARNEETRTLADDPDQQAVDMFQNIRRFMEAAGGTTDDIVQVMVYVKDEKYRESINKAWVKMFPDESNRPARHVLTTEVRAAGALFQVQLMAVV